MITSSKVSSHKKTIIEDYLDSIKDLILEVESNLNNENRKRELQEKLENIWINQQPCGQEDKLDDNNHLINRYPNKFYSVIGEAWKTLDGMQEGNYLNKKFPQLGSGEELNILFYLMLTFSLCISLYSRLSYNALAIKVGEDILYSVYKKNMSINKKKKLQSVEFITFK